MKKVDAVISRVINELDAEQAAYQDAYRRYNGREDMQAKHTHQLLLDLCRRLQKELSKAGV
jgi:hypothetical protein